jgi:hypothetical protein
MASSAIALSSCTPLTTLQSNVRSLISPHLTQANLELTVQPALNPGMYQVSGKTDFPDRSEIRIAAIRYLKPTKPGTPDLTSKPTYSVLAYQAATVNQGKWQTTLNLWQIAKDGRFQEAWQINQVKLKLPVKPVPEVVFLATLAPTTADPIQQLEHNLKKQGKELNSGLVSSTTDGSRYLRAVQQVTVALPTGKAAPPKITPADINGGWGRRYLIPPEPPIPYTLEFPKERRTNAPPASGEFLR